MIDRNYKEKQKIKIMAVLMEFAIFPTDLGGSVSKYVSKVIKMIDGTKFNYQLTPMGTIVETSTTKEALNIVEDAYNVLEPYSERVYATIKLDIKKEAVNMMSNKIKSIEDKIGQTKK